MSHEAQASAAGERKRSRFLPGILTGAFAVAAFAVVAHETDHIDLTPKKSNGNTVEAIFEEANQDCADTAAKEVADGITSDDIAQADSIAKLTEDANAEAAEKTDACVVEATGIPVGTDGFEIQHPTIVVAGSAAVVNG